jgi:hypothetical protein
VERSFKLMTYRPGRTPLRSERRTLKTSHSQKFIAGQPVRIAGAEGQLPPLARFSRDAARRASPTADGRSGGTYGGNGRPACESRALSAYGQRQRIQFALVTATVEPGNRWPSNGCCRRSPTYGTSPTIGSKSSLDQRVFPEFLGLDAGRTEVGA